MKATEGPVGAGSPANAAVAPPSHSRVNPLPQGPYQGFSCVSAARESCTRPHTAPAGTAVSAGSPR
ncbi:hypothetical protein C6A77_24720 [Pseudomonas sp. AFG_SD02_1510_Pfu_092]|nr:hypothetical protein C6A77_24720 [Pseudomonas sp. AFG_SD02_1510_Pfu_092]